MKLNYIFAFTYFIQASIPEPYQLSALILCTTFGTALPVLVLQAVLKFIQNHSGGGDIGAWLAGALLPAVLTRLGFSKDPTEIRVLLIKVLLVLFSLVRAEQKSVLFELFLTPMCANISEHASDVEFLTVCGRGLTHLARLEPDTFRAQVPLLSDRHRTVLQQVMKLALQQQQQQQSGGDFGNNNGGGGGGGFGAASNSAASGAASTTASTAGAMQINMSKYRK